MHIKHKTVIDNHIRETFGVTYHNVAQLRDLSAAKVALETDNLKSALELILRIQLRNLDLGITMCDITKILNTPIEKESPETFRDIISQDKG